MESALEEVEFLARSANRVEVLRCLADGRYTRNDLAAATGASQATLGRILADYRERAWIRRVDGRYEATATGALVADGVTDLLDVVETERALRGVVEYLPTDAMDVDLRHLADATITVPSGTRPDAPVKRDLDLIRGAETVTVFSHAFNEQSLAAVAERVTAGEATFRGVFSSDAIDALAGDATLRRRLERLLDADDAEVRVCEGDVPVAATVADGVVHLILRDRNSVLRASVDSDDEAVLEWAHDAFLGYWRDATPLERETLR